MNGKLLENGGQVPVERRDRSPSLYSNLSRLLRTAGLGGRQALAGGSEESMAGHAR